MNVSRRGFLALLGGAAAGGLLSGCGGLGAAGQTGEQLVSALPLPEPYRVPLPVPPVARPVGRDAAGAELYRMTQRVAAAEILPGVRTPVLGYDGIFPGPTIETRRGRPVVVRHRNELPVPTAVHVHGGHTAAEHDGWPLDLVLPAGDSPAGPVTTGWPGRRWPGGGERDYRYDGDQRAAALWYHDHRMDFTGPAIYRGLAGFHLIRDEVEDALPLPAGERELPLMICDRSFAADGSFAYPGLDQGMRHLPGVQVDWMEGVLGDVVLVNGAPGPVHEVDARALPAAVAQRGERPPVPAGADRARRAGPAVRADRLGRRAARRAGDPAVLDIAPGERFDVVVDFSVLPVGTEVTMINALGVGRVRDVLRFRVVRTARDDSRVPARLSDVEQLAPPPDAPLRTFRFTRGVVGDHRGWTINGQRSTRTWRWPRCRWGAPRCGASSPTCTIRCTFTWTRSRCCAAATPGRGRSTAAGRTPSTCGRRRWSTSRCGSPGTPAGSCCTATTWSTRTWP